MRRRLYTMPPARSAADAAPPIPVAALAEWVKDVLAAGLPPKVRVVGEVSNFSGRGGPSGGSSGGSSGGPSGGSSGGGGGGGGHWFFSLKDDAAAIRCVMFASHARRVTFPVHDGLEVVATGRVDFYPAQGNLQLYVDRLSPVGEGALQARLKALIEELRGLGYLDPATKKPLPLVPRCVAVVTSRSAAALQDVINTAQRRWPGCRLLLKDVRVQGDAAAGEIAAAIDALSEHGAGLGVEAVIVTRGGGSIEDLWAFNERVVADAIHRCTLPVVAAIGHEVDTTVAELVADHRAATPTQAVMALIPDRAALEHQVDQLGHRLRLMLRRRSEAAAHRVDAAARHPLLRDPQRLLTAARDRVDALDRRLAAAVPRRLAPARERVGRLATRLDAAPPRRLDAARRRLDALTKHLEAVGPQQVLDRGYSYTLDGEGRLVRRVTDAPAGTRLTTVLSDGRVTSRVEGDAPPPPPAPPPAATPARPRKPRRRKPPPPGQSGLFG